MSYHVARRLGPSRLHGFGAAPTDAVANFNVKFGSSTSGKDDRVQQVQAALNAQGASPSLKIDGVFGQLTQNAVCAFQAANGLPVTGIVDGPTSLKLQDSDANNIGFSFTKTVEKLIPTGVPVPLAIGAIGVLGVLLYRQVSKRRGATAA